MHNNINNINNILIIFKNYIIKLITFVKTFNNKYTIYFLIIISCLFLIQYLQKRYKNNCNSTQNRYYIDKDEIINGENYYLYSKNNIRHIFWTGGYDSTYLLIDALLIKGNPVQPIYLKCQNLDTQFGILGRNNQDLEIKTMKKIRDIIIKNYPFCKSRFLPTLYVYNIQKDISITKKFKQIHNDFNFFSRDINQYERMARFSIHYGYPIEVGLEKCGTGLDESTTGIRINEGTKECKIITLDSLKSIKTKKNNQYLNYTLFDIFKNFRFPIVHLTKEDCKLHMLNEKKYYLLQLTISCWNPIHEKPCGLCPQCLQRIT